MTDSASAGATTPPHLTRDVLLVAAVVTLGAIMSILDTTIVNVAIRTLAGDFHASLNSIQWVATGYMLALAVVIPLAGWASDRFGGRNVWMTSVVLFAAGSALAGTAWNTDTLILFRVLQGLGGGMIMPAGMIMLARAAGPERVGTIMSIIGVPMLLGPILGPVIGGWLVDGPGWRWIFYVNVPIAVISLALAWKVLPRGAEHRGWKLDWRGVLLLSPGLALFVYGLDEIASTGDLTSWKSLGAILVGAALVIGFVRHAMRTDEPLIEVHLFRRGAVAAAALTTLFFGSAFFGTMFLLPLYYQIVRGSSALEAGVVLMAQGIGAALMMPIGGRLVDRGYAGRVVLTGLVLMLAGTICWATVSAGTSFWWLNLFLFVRGLGMGLTMMPAMAAAYQTLDRAQVSRATTALNIIQRVGGALGTAILSVVLERRFATEGAHAITSRFHGHVPANAPALSFGSIAGGAKLPEFLAGPFAHGFDTTFWWASALTAVAFIPALTLPRSPKGVERTATR